MSEFLNYSVSRPITGNKDRYLVTAEYMDGYEVLSSHDTRAEAEAALKRYVAADTRRAAHE